MKKSLLVLSILLAGVAGQARTIECTDVKNNETVVSLTDDMGYIVRGDYTIFGQTNEFSVQERLPTYSYYYGEYLTIKDVNYDEEVIEVVAVRIPGSTEFTGFFNFYQPEESQTLYSTKIKCLEP